MVTVVGEKELGPDAELMHHRRVLVRILDAPLDQGRVDVVGADRDETVLQAEHRRVAAGVRRDEQVHELRRVQRHLALRAVAVGVLVEDPVAPLENPALRRLPVEREPRREVVAIGVHQGAREDVTPIRRGEDLAGCGVDVRHRVGLVLHRREVLVAQAEVQRQVGRRPPGVLGKHAVSVGEDVRLVEERETLLARQTQQEVAEARVRVAAVAIALEAVQGAQVEVDHLVAAPFESETSWRGRRCSRTSCRRTAAPTTPGTAAGRRARRTW